ncbi:phosphonate transport system substrate-binding protein [Rhizobium sp. NFR07]|uniref:PhnD/SsuA/transferrin family substrate-binding protein n=1 Tax=Rhizobium sp. NFR07 TaxID=1566262 RepID=UPI0008EEF502|nr:PhnD/SsuA/transferrin family substrate-binding protein [Rhizobium sp. NFR07]SFA74088.1 phosphonate transport system substrate-binding protein [Rhizobium sp. NFR07]
MRRLISALVAVTVTASSAFAADKVRFAVTEIEGLEQLQTEFGPFRDKLQQLTGLDIEFQPVSSRTSAVEAMNSGQLELALTGPSEYVVMHEMTKAEVIAGWQRPDYFAQVVTIAGRGINTVKDLSGKKIAFGSAGSTSTHLGPAQALADQGLAYGKDYQSLHIDRNVAIQALINGDLDAVGMSFDHLNSARKAFPNVAFLVVARGRDLPDDALMASPKADQAAIEKVRKAFTEHGQELLGAVLNGTDDNQKYASGVFRASVKDSDYGYVRAMYNTIGIDTFGKFIDE